MTDKCLLEGLKLEGLPAPRAAWRANAGAIAPARSHPVKTLPPSSAALPTGADVLFLALLDTKELTAALSEAGLNKAQVAAAVEEGRGSARVDSATADTQFDALGKPCFEHSMYQNTSVLTSF